MTAGQRKVIMTLAGTVSVLASALIGVALTGVSAKSPPRALKVTTRPASPSVPSSTNTTVDLVPLSLPSGSLTSGSGSVSGSAPGSGAPAPGAPGALQQTPAPPNVTATTSTTATLRLASGVGAVIVPPGSSQLSRKQIDLCSSLADSGWSATGCGLVHATGTDLTWLTESHAAPPGIRAYVFKPTGVSMWNVALVAADDSGTRFSEVKVRVDNIAGDGGEDIVFGFHAKGSGSVLSLDLVHGGANVVDHQDLSRGSARSTAGELDTWRAKSGQGEPFEHDVVQLVQGAWRVVTEEAVPAASVPPSQL